MSNPDENPYESPAPTEADQKPSGLAAALNPSSIALAAAVVLLSVGLAFLAPIVGIPLLVLAIPALIRAFGVGARRRAEGEAPPIWQRILFFITSFGVVALAAVSALIVFVVICLPVGFLGFSVGGGMHGGGDQDIGTTIMIGGWIVGVGAGLLIAGVLLWALWRQRY